MSAYTPPTHVPSGTTHVTYVLGEAEEAFARGDRNCGVINLCHAIHVLATKREEMDDGEARAWFARITHAAEVWK